MESISPVFVKWSRGSADTRCIVGLRRWRTSRLADFRAELAALFSFSAHPKCWCVCCYDTDKSFLRLFFWFRSYVLCRSLILLLAVPQVRSFLSSRLISATFFKCFSSNSESLFAEFDISLSLRPVWCRQLLFLTRAWFSIRPFGPTTLHFCLFKAAFIPGW